jgi:hypothetical protein
MMTSMSQRHYQAIDLVQSHKGLHCLQLHIGLVTLCTTPDPIETSILALMVTIKLAVVNA